MLGHHAHALTLNYVVLANPIVPLMIDLTLFIKLMAVLYVHTVTIMVILKYKKINFLQQH